MLGLLSDFLRFLVAVVLGQKDSARVFIEALDMADRYTRWGSERGDLRDVQSALRELDGCRDEAAPSKELLARKYRVHARVIEVYADIRIRMFQAGIAEALAARKELEGEARFHSIQMETSKHRLDELRREQSHYTAKEEERNLSNLQAHQEALQAKIEQDESTIQINAEFEKLVSEIEALCEEAERQVATLQIHHLLDTAYIEEIQTGLWQRLQAVRENVQAAVPAGTE